MAISKKCMGIENSFSGDPIFTLGWKVVQDLQFKSNINPAPHLYAYFTQFDWLDKNFTLLQIP